MFKITLVPFGNINSPSFATMKNSLLIKFFLVLINFYLITVTSKC